MSDGFSEQDIQLAGFFVRARPVMRRVGFVLVLTIEIIMIVFGFYYWGQWFSDSRIAQLRSVHQFANQNVAAARLQRSVLAAQPLNVVGVRVLDGALDTRDYVAVVENSNDRWIARVRYSFAGNTQTEFGSGVVLPGQRHVLGVFGSDVKMSQARFVIEDVVWKYIDAHQVADIESFVSERNRVRVENVVYDLADVDITTDRVTFDLFNDSAFGYFNVLVTAVMYFNEDIVGVEQVDVSPFRAFSEQKVEIHTKARGIKPTRVEVLSQVRMFDESSYITIGD